MKSETRFGFTLIELLIVVAIIAILAAIAVPNFLEAQTRSKVSRIKSDQRSLATAVESYAVDYTRVPIGRSVVLNSDINPTGKGNDTNQTDLRVYQQLTTPVAYLTFIPTDLFSVGAVRTTNTGSVSRSTIMRMQSTVDQTYIHSTEQPAEDFRNCLKIGVTWFCYSLGPMRRWGPNPQAAISGSVGPYPNAYYDPTNGTVSRGFIVRSSRGPEPGK